MVEIARPPLFTNPNRRIEFTELNEPKIMYATLAFHRYGDLTSKSTQICYIYGQQELYYIGCWIREYPNFHDVHFPKSSTWEMNVEEQTKFKRDNPITWETLRKKHAQFFKIKHKNNHFP